jgi:hypothetical protein
MYWLSEHTDPAGALTGNDVAEGRILRRVSGHSAYF